MENAGTKSQQDQQYRHKAALKIIKLLAPTKKLSVSNLMLLKKEELNEVGKAARQLYDALDRAGRVMGDKVSEGRW